MNLGLPEMIFIFLLALIIFGPKKLPEIGRQIGKAMNEFKRASNEFKAQIEGEMRNLELEELAKREATPQILPPENTHPVSPNVGGYAASAAQQALDSGATEAAGGNSHAALDAPTELPAPEEATQPKAPEPPASAKAADV